LISVVRRYQLGFFLCGPRAESTDSGVEGIIEFWFIISHKEFVSHPVYG